MRSGGTLIAGSCTGRHDEETFGVPGEMARGFTELFGEHKELNVLPAGSSHVLTGTGEFAGQEIAEEAADPGP